MFKGAETQRLAKENEKRPVREIQVGEIQKICDVAEIKEEKFKETEIVKIVKYCTAEKQRLWGWREFTGFSNKEEAGDFNVSIFSEIVGAECELQWIKEWMVRMVN